MGTNIFSIYGDPEDDKVWDMYNLKGADLVVSCMWNRGQRYVRAEFYTSCLCAVSPSALHPGQSMTMDDCNQRIVFVHEGRAWAADVGGKKQ